jgi:YVTN family beta-propeller protein
LFAVLALLGCDQTKPGTARSSGSVAISKDDALVYAVDNDSSQLGVVNAKTHALVANVKVGSWPARVVVAPDETIYVANRGSNSVSVIRKGEWTVVSEVPTDVDPAGLALSPDGKTLLVACATAPDDSSAGTLAAYDTVSLTRSWTVKLPDESRSVAWLDTNGGQAAVGLYRSGEVALVDVNGHQLLQNQAGIYDGVNATALGLGFGGTGAANGQTTFHGRAMSDVVTSPDGKRLYALGQLATEGIIPPPPPQLAGGSTHPYYESKGPGFAGSVSTAAVFTFNAGVTLSPAVDDLWHQGTDADHPQTSYANGGLPGDPLVQGPTAAATDPNGDWLYMVNRESQNVIVVPAKSRNAHQDQNGDGTMRFTQLPSVYGEGSVGGGADGIAVASDNKSVWVYSQFDHQLVELKQDNSLSHLLELVPKGGITISGETLDATQVAGRKLFYDANDRRISGRGAAIACSTCHLEGRDDAHVWKFPDGPRQTPSLAGRGLLDTAPYHWSGEFLTLADFLDHTLTVRMGGTGLDSASADTLNQYIASLPAPQNPYLGAQPTDAQLRGATVFAAAGCGACHTGQWLTNDMMTDVGTLTPTDSVTGLNVPSLRGLARTAPYLHDGSALTLRERLEKNPGDKHGVTSTLTSSQLDDLVAYLLSL